MALMQHSEKKLAHILGKMAAHIKANEGRLEREGKILKRLEKSIKETEGNIKHHERLLLHHELALKRMRSQKDKGPLEKINAIRHEQAAVGIKKHILVQQLRLRSLAALFQRHMILKTGIEANELQIISTAKDCLEIIKHRKIVGAAKDKGIVIAATEEHALTKSQGRHLEGNIELVHKKAEMMARHNRMFGKALHGMKR